MTTAVDATSTNNSVLQNYLDKQAQTVAADKSASASSGTTSSSSTSSATSTSMWGNFDTYLKILTTQLQSQDPTNTTDPNQFTQELVQFAGVEQQLYTNKKLDTIINMQQASSGVTASLNYIGQYVEVPSSGKLALEDGKAEIGYNLSSAGKSAAVTVLDSSGKTVATLNGSSSTGLNYVTWDGKSSDGTQLEDGAYTFSVKVLNPDGTAQTLDDVRVIGKVTGVTSNSDGTISLSLLGGITAKSAEVDSVYSSGNLPSATKVSSSS